MNTIQDQVKPTDEEDNRWEILSIHYLEKLSGLISTLNLGDELSANLTLKHHFNGAAVYADNSMCASWSPVGLAFMLPPAEVAELIGSGQAKPLKYFAKGRIKKGYALFDNPESKQTSALQTYFLKAAEQATSTRDESRA